MKNILLLFSLLAGCLLSGCEKEVTGIKLPDSVSKLLVSSFISPQDTIIRVYVTRSVPNLGYRQPGSKPVENASVSLSDGTQTRPLAFTGQMYSVDTRNFPIMAGATYTLRVSVPGGETAEATCTVPQALTESPTVIIDSVLYSDDLQRDYFVRLHWDDVAGQENYYRPLGEVNMEIKQPPDNKPSDSIPPFILNQIYWEGDVFLDDQGKDGEPFQSPKGRMFTLFSDLDAFGTIELYAYVLHTDRHYYQYHRSVQLATRSMDNPFAEPVLVYSNVTGGLGIFAAFNAASIVVRVK